MFVHLHRRCHRRSRGQHSAKPGTSAAAAAAAQHPGRRQTAGGVPRLPARRNRGAATSGCGGTRSELCPLVFTQSTGGFRQDPARHPRVRVRVVPIAERGNVAGECGSRERAGAAQSILGAFEGHVHRPRAVRLAWKGGGSEEHMSDRTKMGEGKPAWHARDTRGGTKKTEIGKRIHTRRRAVSPSRSELAAFADCSTCAGSHWKTVR